MDNTYIYIIIIGLSFLCSILFEMMLLPRIIFIAKKKRLFDMPDARKKHQMFIPRLGGISFLPVILGITLFTLFIRCKYDLSSDLLIAEIFPEFLLLICGMILIFSTGVKDDLVGVWYGHKFLVQFIAAFFIIYSDVYIDNLHGLFGIYEIPSYIGIPLSILIIVYTTNAINLIDGADGLASGLSGLAFVVYGSLFIIGGLWTYATIAFIVCGVLIPFFYYNFFHAKRKIFMGDTGSLTLGYLASFMMLRLLKTPLNSDILPDEGGCLILILAALYIPLYDAARVMIVRLVTGRSPFSPDRNHIHHKLIDMGLSRKRAVSVILVMAVSFFVINYLLTLLFSANTVFIIDIAISFLVAFSLISLTKKKLYPEKIRK